MTDTTPAPSSIQINIKGPSELKLQIDISTEKTVRELKQAIADKSDVEADRQRLIYSGTFKLSTLYQIGKLTYDDDALSTYKIQSGHTIHMVKGAARAGGAAGTPAAPSTSQPLPQMQTGQNVHDPLSQLNSHLAFGQNLSGFNPFQDMGVNPNDPNMMANMLNSPEFMQQMSSVMSNPQVVEQIIQSNPQLQAMGPRVREIFQSEGFRQMLSNPDAMRNMLQMSSMMQRAGMGPGGAGAGGLGGMFGGAPGQSSFPAPGAHSGAPATDGAGAATGATGAAPGAGAGGLPGMDPNALAQLLGGFGGGGAPGAAGAAGANGAGAGFGGFNPFMFGGLGGLGGLGGAGGAGSPPPPAANLPPPEERFQVQLQQLQDMGFTNAQQNIRALLATGGNVHSAIEYILGGGGL
ncbi:hypothetical protein PENSPDRAFT_580312 [Peniophora sp. CONT]|nr:hypothetical protein PENSPDRAFT_580312 [Peniophora sp. CONT]